MNEDDEDEKKTPALISPAVDIRYQAGVGIILGDRGGTFPRNLLGLARLVKVDGCPVKGLPIDDIRKMLLGPAGSEVQLTVLDNRRALMTLILTRIGAAPADVSKNLIAHAGKACDLLDSFDSDDLPSACASAASSCERIGAEPFGTALMAAAAANAGAWLNGNSVMALLNKIQAAKHFDDCGRIGQADNCVKVALSQLEYMSQGSYMLRNFLAEFAGHLDRTARFDGAAQVYKKLVEFGATDTQVRHAEWPMLSRYAEYMAEDGQIDEAEQSYDRMLKIVSNNRAREIVTAAEFFTMAGKPRKAISVLEKYIAEVEANEPEELRKSERDQPLVLALYRLAMAQMRGSKNSGAIQSLKKAIDIYAGRLDALQQVEVEYLPEFFPAPSDLECALAEAYHDTGVYELGEQFARSAVEKIEVALGKDSSYLRKPLLVYSLCREALGDGEGADAIKARAEKLVPPWVPPKESVFASIYRDIALAYGAIMRGESAAVLIDKLHAALEEARPCDAEASRLNAQLWSSLIYLSRLYLEQRLYSDAKVLQEKLIESAARHNQKQRLLPLYCDRDYFAEQLGLDGKLAWSEFQTSLSECLSVDSKKDLIECLRRLGMVYSFAGDNERALSLLNKAINRLGYDGVSLYDTDPALLADLAIANLRSGRLERANKYVAAVLSGQRQVETKVAAKLVLAAELYSSLGQVESGTNIVEQASNILTYPRQTKQSHNINLASHFLWKSAKLIAHRDQESARIKATQAIELCKPVVAPSALQILAADLAFSSGDTEASSRLYLNAAESLPDKGLARLDPAIQDLKEQLGKRALGAVENPMGHSTKPDPWTLKGIADLLWVPERKKAGQLYEEALKFPPATPDSIAELANKIAGLSAFYNEGTQKQLDLRIMVAEAEEKAGKKYAYSLWVGVAADALRANQIDEGIRHVEHALDLQAMALQKSDKLRPAVSDRESGLVFELRRLQQSGTAETLFKKEIANLATIYGGESHEVAEAISELAVFYANEKRYDDLVVAGNRIFEIYSLHGAVAPASATTAGHPAIRRFDEAMRIVRRQGVVDLGIGVTSKLLSIQRQKLGPKNHQLCETLELLGSFYKELEEYDKAAPLYKEAWDIACTHGTGLASYFCAEYCEVLRKMGLTDDADRLMTVNIKVPHEPTASELYMKAIEKKIKSRWHQPGAKGLVVVVVFHIHKDGKVGDIAVHKTSGIAVFDRSAVDAVARASPFPPLPEGFGPAAKFRIVFDWDKRRRGGDESIKRL